MRKRASLHSLEGVTDKRNKGHMWTVRGGKKYTDGLSHLDPFCMSFVLPVATMGICIIAHRSHRHFISHWNSYSCAFRRILTSENDGVEHIQGKYYSQVLPRLVYETDHVSFMASGTLNLSQSFTVGNGAAQFITSITPTSCALGIPHIIHDLSKETRTRSMISTFATMSRRVSSTDEASYSPSSTAPKDAAPSRPQDQQPLMQDVLHAASSLVQMSRDGPSELPQSMPPRLSMDTMSLSLFTSPEGKAYIGTSPSKSDVSVNDKRTTASSAVIEAPMMTRIHSPLAASKSSFQKEPSTDEKARALTLASLAASSQEAELSTSPAPSIVRSSGRNDSSHSQDDESSGEDSSSTIRPPAPREAPSMARSSGRRSHAQASATQTRATRTDLTGGPESPIRDPDYTEPAVPSWMPVLTASGRWPCVRFNVCGLDAAGRVFLKVKYIMFITEAEDDVDIRRPGFFYSPDFLELVSRSIFRFHHELPLILQDLDCHPDYRRL